MLRLLAGVTLLLTAADHWTTFLCLEAPAEGWDVTEANPVADYLFSSLGVVPGLVIDSLVTVLAIAYLLTTTRLPLKAKYSFLCLVVVWTSYAVANNLAAISLLGLNPLGIG